MRNETNATSRLGSARLSWMPFIRAGSITALCLSSIVASANPTTRVSPSNSTSLYDRLGGKPVVEQVVGRMVDLAAADAQTRHTFDGVSLKALKIGLASHLCAVSGGPCHYEGGSLKDTHAHLAITVSQFQIVEQYFIQALNEANVAPEAQHDVLRLLAPMQSDVVSK